MENSQRRLQAIASQLVPAETSAKKSIKRGPNGPQSCPMNFQKVFPRLMEDRPIRVLVTGAAGNIAYSLIFMIANGQMFGPHQKVLLNLLDIAPMAEALKGVEMEIQDGAFPLVQEVLATTDIKLGFTNVDVAVLVGAFPRQKGMERKDLLKKNAAIFQEQGRALDQFASKNVKVVVVGNPANTNCAIAMANAPGLPKENFSALTRLDHNRAKAQIALRLGTDVTNVHNVVIWGNHSSTQYPDVNLGYVDHYPSQGLKTPVRSAVNDEQWIQNHFISTVQLRGAEIIKARKLSSAASAAQAIVGHVRDWLLGTNEGEIVSMAVPSDGSYDIPRDVVYSFPVTCAQGQWKIVQGLRIDDFSRKKMQITLDELQEERTEAFSFLQK